MMSLGGGFLDQMNKTMKQNRDMVKRILPKPFEKTKAVASEATGELIDKAPMSEMERRIFMSTLKARRRRDQLVRYGILVLMVGAGAIFILKFIRF